MPFRKWKHFLVPRGKKETVRPHTSSAGGVAFPWTSRWHAVLTRRGRKTIRGGFLRCCRSKFIPPPRTILIRKRERYFSVTYWSHFSEASRSSQIADRPLATVVMVFNNPSVFRVNRKFWLPISRRLIIKNVWQIFFFDLRDSWREKIRKTSPPHQNRYETLSYDSVTKRIMEIIFMNMLLWKPILASSNPVKKHHKNTFIVSKNIPTYSTYSTYSLRFPYHFGEVDFLF